MGEVTKESLGQCSSSTPNRYKIVLDISNMSCKWMRCDRSVKQHENSDRYLYANQSQSMTPMSIIVWILYGDWFLKFRKSFCLHVDVMQQRKKHEKYGKII